MINCNFCTFNVFVPRSALLCRLIMLLSAHWVQYQQISAIGFYKYTFENKRLHCFKLCAFFWCRIHLWFRWLGGLQAKSMTSYRAEPSKMAGMRYHGTVMTTTRWGLYIIKKTIITRSVYTFNSKSTVWACYRCILHLQQYSHRLNLFFWGSRRHLPHLLCSKGPNYQRGVLLISASAIEGYFEGIKPREGH